MEQQSIKYVEALRDHDRLMQSQIQYFVDEGKSENEAIEMTNAIITGRLKLHGAALVPTTDSAGNTERWIVPSKSNTRPDVRTASPKDAGVHLPRLLQNLLLSSSQQLSTVKWASSIHERQA